MSLWRRLLVVVWVWIGIGITSIIYYRVGVAHLFPAATEEHTGPFSGPVETLELIVPAVLLILGFGVIVWAIVAGAQEERARYQRGRY